MPAVNFCRRGICALAELADLNADDVVLDMLAERVFRSRDCRFGQHGYCVGR